eukprot:scaffold136756_cov41-Attheya_sp.AAC.1
MVPLHPFAAPPTKAAKESPGLGNWLVALGQKPGQKDRASTPASTHPISSLAKAAKETPTYVSNSFAVLDEGEDDEEVRMDAEAVDDVVDTEGATGSRMQDMEGRNAKAAATMLPPDGSTPSPALIAAKLPNGPNPTTPTKSPSSATVLITPAKKDTAQELASQPPADAPNKVKPAKQTTKPPDDDSS